VEHRHRMTLERMREHLARADSELKAAQHFLNPEARDEDEMAFVRAIADARTLVGDALETARWRLEETEREQAVWEQARPQRFCGHRKGWNPYSCPTRPLFRVSPPSEVVPFAHRASLTLSSTLLGNRAAALGMIQ
jgi:hypothetical protein